MYMNSRRKQSLWHKQKTENTGLLKGTLGLENKEIAECAFFWDYNILGWGEPMAKIFGLWVN